MNLGHHSAQTAIDLSLQTKRPLLVLVRAAAETDSWADDFLQLPQMQELLRAGWVPLQVVEGTQDFVFFTQIFPVSEIPCIVLIHGSTATQHNVSEVDEESFFSRISGAVGGSASGQEASNHEEPTATETTPAPDTTNSDEGVQSPATSAPTPAATSQPVSSSQTPRQASVPTHSSPPRQPAAQPASQPASQPAASTSAPRTQHGTTPQRSSSSTPTDNEKHQQRLRKQRQAEAEERKRILRLLETDKEERRARAQRNHTPIEHPAPTTSAKPRAGSSRGDCALVVRLFNGSTIKNTFKGTDSLVTVRQWVDEARTDSDQPYCFFQNFPKHTFGDAEESSRLMDLSLCPSAALILKPAKNVSTAYTASPYSPTALLGSGTRMVTDAVYTFLGIGYKPEVPIPESPSSRASSEVPGLRDQLACIADERRLDSTSRTVSETNIRTLQDGADNEDRVTYNGNHLDLEDDKRDDSKK